MLKKITISFAIFLGLANMAMAQEGSLSGKIVDQETGEELIGATAFIPSTGQGSVTDIYGNYQIKGIAPGSYTLEISYVSYQKQIIQNVQIIDGKNTVINVTLALETDQLQEVVITAERINNNEIALLSLQKKSFAVQDGISSEEIGRLGVSNAAESVRQVTGASIEEGKYVVMRGLGDRYSVTQMNGVALPSTDPYRNSSNMDLIPSNMIENLVTVKTFTPDQPGNFTGGKVDVTTKSMPDEFYFNFGLSTTYNTQASLRDGFFTDAAEGQLDWLGYDDGTRDIPGVVRRTDMRGFNDQAIAGRDPDNLLERDLVNRTAKSFDNPFVPDQITAPLNYGFNLSTGNSSEVFGKRFGYNLGVVFNRNYTFYDDGRSGFYQDNNGNLRTIQNFNEIRSQTNTQIGGLLGLSLQLSNNHELQFTSLYNHDGQSAFQRNVGFWLQTSYDQFDTRGVLWMERGLLNNQLSGKHYIDKHIPIKIDWLAGYVLSNQKEPDSRIFAFGGNFQEDGTLSFILNQSEIGILPTHFYRDLEDAQINGKIDVVLELSKENDNQIKFGGLYSNKQRDFSENFYSLIQQIENRLNPDYFNFGEIQNESELERFFDPSNAGVVNTPESTGTGRFGFGNVYTDLTQLRNSYEGEEVITAGYVMGVYNLSPKFKLIGGLRLENTDLSTVSEDSSRPRGDISTLDLLPSLNGMLKLSENSNFRVAASQTIARPNMREISPFAATATIGYPIFVGNPELDRTLIQNFDLRYETYPRTGELFAVSAYYKNFEDPIIFQLTPGAGSPEIVPVNSENALVLGAEVEFRKSLDFISEALSNFKLSTNFSLIFSEVDKGEEELAALRNEQAQGRRLNIEDTRPFQGQSPYIINFALSHVSDALQWENTLSFNIFGERLSYVTGALDPDVYEQPRPSLNFVSTRQLNEHLNLGVKVMNILNMEFLHEYDFNGEFVFQSFRRGTNFNVSLSYSL